MHEFTSGKSDRLIQDIFPNISSQEREFILTGYTHEDWEFMFLEYDLDYTQSAY